MIRLSLLYLLILSVAVYAFRDWFRSLCALILLMAVVQHPDMPKTMFGIQGLNPWNFLLAFVILGWLTSRRREGLFWDMPRHISLLLLLYLGVVLVGFYRMWAGPHVDDIRLKDLENASTSSAYLVSEYLVNTIKWVIPGLLLFDGCRNRERFLLGLASCLGVYFLLGIQVIRWMPPTYLLDAEALAHRSYKILLKEVGYHRVNLSMMLAGASWAIFSTRALARSARGRFLLLLASLAMVYAQALTGGRAGYVTWLAVGLVLCLMRWWRYLLVVPVIVAAIAWAVPGARARMLQGFTPESRDTNPKVAQQVDTERPDDYTITSGRTLIWPYVIQKVGERPLFGWGRQAMRTTGLSRFLWEELAEVFPHPHNAYLEFLLDNGWFGLCLVMPFYLAILGHGLALFRDSRSPVFVAAGGAALSLVLALLFASTGSQTFYPREGAVGMWCAIGLLLRASVERSRVLTKVQTAAFLAWRDARRQAQAALAAGSRVPAARAQARPAPAHLSLDGLLWTRAS